MGVTLELIERLEAQRRRATPGWHANPSNHLSVTSSMDHPIWSLSDARHRAVHDPGSIVTGVRIGEDREYLLAMYDAMPVMTKALREVAFQSRVQPWMQACFGAEISSDKVERSDRFIEEALELVQAGGYTADRAHALVDYVFGRPQGELNQEIGGVMVTLAALCLAHSLDMHAAGETELARIWTKVEQIRAKQAAKPTGSALPVAQS